MSTASTATTTATTPAAPAVGSKQYSLAVLHGDGIGPEIVPASVKILDAAVAAAGATPIAWTELPLGRSAIDEYGEHTPTKTLDALDEVDGWLLGPHDSAAYPEPYRSQLNPSGTIRKHFGLFANIRPAKAFRGGNAIVEGTDLVIVRENTEGFYADRNTFAGTGEMMPTPDVAIMHGIITRAATERIAHEAFQLARTRDKRVTIVHKANVLKMTTGLFRDVCREVGKQYPDVAINDFHIDAATVHLVRRADKFDVIVTENMFGDILSDLAGEVAGSLGIAPSINSSATHAMAQASHGSAPDIAGRDIANPIAMILSSAMLLRWLAAKFDDEKIARAADIVEAAVDLTVAEGATTPDMGGTSSCSGFADAVVAATARV
ncbi:isocitrate/isopropylmalate dehydrogenase family protein [Kineococcus radiotolerans]|uniref:3-isopropylmalate dehydrogenase n=1 Tax=Kineococcus radiotolerans (strain ATCC BAA-149 / DSM 14245 / SRS30216) TaxID=266940 RepID=A6WAX5_KINRD|nr:isocitrate/isopropylmalate dehydrogenase family protein [Kineococcus radiotolerans]ABS03964.1 3-isopropylmalate dehydrogenase [Kineococcus radiotolerans SRS30216 = ATCC BAA-149]